MRPSSSYDAVVVGAGPNGLAAAIVLARAGRRVLVLEARETIGGGTRSSELTLPGFVHDICSAIHPLAVSSPFFRTLPLAKHGLEWVFPPAALAHPLDDGTSVVIERSLETTAASLGADGPAYRRLLSPLVGNWSELVTDVLRPLPLPPRHPLTLARFGLRAIWPAALISRRVFRDVRARALFAGIAGHSMLPLETPLTAAFGLLLGASAHAVGWPLARGGSQAIGDALAGYLRSLGGETSTNHPVENMRDLPPARAVLFDLTPRQVLAIAGERLPVRYQAALRRYRYGPGAFKVDFALDGPIPWRAPGCARAATVHVGGSFEAIAAAERAVWRGEHPEQPFVLVAQPSLFDATRAPAGQHTAWAYCHVPHGSTRDMRSAIEGQIERFAPGFRDRILAVHTFTAAEMQAYNPNYVGGDINGGVQDLAQLYARPTWRLRPYAMPARGLYLCSSSTPPGGGVHGMCGYHAAHTALRDGL